MSDKDIPTIIMVSDKHGLIKIMTDRPLNVIELFNDGAGDRTTSDNRIERHGKVKIENISWTVYEHNGPRSKLNPKMWDMYLKAAKTLILKNQIKEAAGVEPDD